MSPSTLALVLNQGIHYLWCGIIVIRCKIPSALPAGYVPVVPGAEFNMDSHLLHF